MINIKDFIKFFRNFIYNFLVFFIAPFNKRFNFLYLKMKEINVKKYFISLIDMNYKDNTFLFIIKLLILYPFLKLLLDVLYIIFIITREFYYSMLEAIFEIFFEIIYFVEQYEIMKRKKILVFLKFRVFYFLQGLKKFLYFNFLKINKENLHQDGFFIGLIDSIFLFFVKIIDIILDVKFIVRIRRFFLFFRKIYVVILRRVKDVSIFLFKIFINIFNFLYLIAVFKSVKIVIKALLKFFKLPRIIMTDEERYHVTKLLTRKRKLHILRNTKFDYSKLLTESKNYKKNIVWSSIFIILLSNILYFFFIFTFFNVLLIFFILLYIYAVLSFAFDWIYDRMEEPENFTDFKTKDFEDEFKKTEDELKEKYLKYYKSVKLNNNRYLIHNQHIKKGKNE
jgi:hypothetical protein